MKWKILQSQDCEIFRFFTVLAWMLFNDSNKNVENVQREMKKEGHFFLFMRSALLRALKNGKGRWMQERDRSAECFMKIESRRRYSVSCRYRYSFERQCFRKILDSIFPADVFMYPRIVLDIDISYTYMLRAREMNILSHNVTVTSSW